LFSVPALFGLTANACFPFSITRRALSRRCAGDRGDLDERLGRSTSISSITASAGIGPIATLAGRRLSDPDSGCMATITKVTPANTPNASTARTSAPHPSNSGEMFVPCTGFPEEYCTASGIGSGVSDMVLLLAWNAHLSP
jgi:hypothetical protein